MLPEEIIVRPVVTEKSNDDIKNGRVMSIEESKERMRKKYANFHVK